MIWKAIGQSVIGSSHITANKLCEDAIRYAVISYSNENEVLICCACDGAGSATFGGWAADYTVKYVMNALAESAEDSSVVEEADIFGIIEDVYEGLEEQALLQGAELTEYSCTLLGCYITDAKSVFFHLGDGAIVRNDGSGYYTPIWWPHNGEYQNSTAFIIDDRSLRDLKIIVLEEQVKEVALFTDGLQMLALNIESLTVHQPFFKSMFDHLRMADSVDKVAIVNDKLSAYLNSSQINERTDDDKTLFLATII